MAHFFIVTELNKYNISLKYFSELELLIEGEAIVKEFDTFYIVVAENSNNVSSFINIIKDFGYKIIDERSNHNVNVHYITFKKV